MKLKTVDDYKRELEKALADLEEVPDGTYEDMFFQVEQNLYRLRINIKRLIHGESILIFNADKDT